MNDMQFFIVTPFLILPFCHSKLVGGIVLASVSAVCTLVTGIIYTHYDLHASLVTQSKYDYFTIYYSKPYCRINTYLLGIILYLLYKASKAPENEQPKSLKIFNSLVATWGKYVLYIVGIALIHCSVTTVYYFDKYPDDWSQGLATFHELIFRPAFTFGCMCILYPTLIGKGAFLGSILGHPIFNPLGKVTYGTYMLHLLVINVVLNYSLAGHYSTETFVWMNIFTVFSLGYLFSFIVTVLIENPVTQLTRTFLERRSGSREAINKTETKDESSINSSVIR